MHPYGNLPANLAAFCGRLRTEHGFRIGPRELADAATTLARIPLDDERRVRDALRPVLSRSFADVQSFDRAFEAFFYESGRRERTEGHALDRDRLPSAGRGVHRGGVAPHDQSEEISELEELGQVGIIDDEHVVTEQTLVRAAYSPLEGESPAPELAPPDADWRDAGRAFVRSLRTGLSRRWRPASHGRLFDLRRTLRGSLHTGGETVVPRWRARERRRPQLVWLVDASRSMGDLSATGLRCAVATASASTSVETFVFSTALERVTESVRRAAAGERTQLSRLATAWGGGTSIGKCLSTFAGSFAQRLVGRRAVLVVVSDGLDVGDPRLLRDAMTRLRRQSAGIIWLNPLLDTPGYEPTAAGMQAARPAIDVLASVARAADLLRLSRVIRLRR